MTNNSFRDVLAIVPAPHRRPGEYILKDVRNDPSWHPVQAVEWRRDASTGLISMMVNHLNYDDALENFNRNFEEFIK